MGQIITSTPPVANLPLTYPGNKSDSNPMILLNDKAGNVKTMCTDKVHIVFKCFQLCWYKH